MLISKNVNSQEFNKRTCGTDQVMEDLYKKKPNARTEAQQLRKKAKLANKSKKVAPYVVPVVFHVFGTEFNNGSTVDLDIIKEALTLTNEDFQGLNADYTTIDAPFDVIKSPLDITFKLAQLDPDGNPTTGVVFHSEASGMGNYGSTIVQNVAWDNYKYCNVYIARDLYGDGDYYNSGVAWYPSKDMSDQNIARVVYNGSFLGTNTGENFRSVLTHEFGHYLDLAHTFDKGICNNDPNDGDGVADTPSLSSNSSGTGCAVLQNCLNQEINSENFMDYTDCYKMFTQGQVARMTNALDNSVSRNTLWTEANLIATGLSSDLGARIISSSNALEERYLNDGVIESTVDLNCVDCTFTNNSGNLTLGTDYTISNLPAGLTSRITLNSSTKAVLYLEGTATNNEAVNSVSDLVITFLDPMVNGNVADLYSDNLKLNINFKDTYTEFCNVSIGYQLYTHITKVDFNGTTNETGYDGISNYIPTLKFKTKQGQTYPLTITANKGAGGTNDNARIQIWFDWNKDFIYDSSELYATKSYVNSEVDADGNYVFTTDVTIPVDAELGDIAFRVLAHYVQGTDGDTACSYIDSGESEDYGVSILAADTPFTVDFFADKTNVNFAQQVNFSDSSIPANDDTITAWNWSFQGGLPSTSTLRNPQNIVFPEAGVFDVSLEVTTANGDKKTITNIAYITSALSYCDSSPNFGGYFNVNNVTLNTINHQPYLSQSHSFYDTVSTELKVGDTYPITIKTQKGAGGSADVNRVRIWADWNFDSEFSIDELLVSKEVISSNYNASGEFEFTENIIVPANAAVGKRVALRVMGHYVEGTDGDLPYGNYDSGNTNDYAIVITKETSKWTGASDNNWNNAANWEGNTLPANDSDIIILATANMFPIINTATTANTVVIESGASLIANAELTATVTYKRNLATDNWYLVSSPLKDETIENVLANNIFALGNSGNVGLASYNNNGTVWNYQNGASTGNATSGKGYSVKLNTAGELVFTGVLNSNTVTYPITTATNSYNLVGNPYASYVNLGEFFNTNPLTTVVSEATAWVWNQATSSYDLKLAGIDDAFQVAPGQGFFISAAANTNVTFDKANQSHGTDTFQKQANTKTQVNITATSSNGAVKTTKLYYLEGATTGFDNGFDGTVFKGTKSNFNMYSKLVSKENTKEYAVQSLPKENLETTIVPVELKVATDQTIVFSADSFNLPNDTQVFIEDKENNEFVNLSEGNYSVALKGGNSTADQFFVHTTSNKVNDDEITLNDISVYQSAKNELTITGLQAEDNSITIYSAIGKQVMAKTFNSNGTKVIDLPKVSSGVYVINVTSGAKKVNKKVILNN
ncbi:M43 family zinc metalloprotease [Tenacibaculum pacificus]|uniref:M43 family zinc metalloprotease n=1 Tax=Tenacibaculum pacificus TaxID=3018314 RepID=UPI0022F3D974|nr:M43 family zinc metalloprotease [Tenacibaculum pacificus]WBX74688.1 M43 family zinc metalloprotease [Tenacibaculum pacificus]